MMFRTALFATLAAALVMTGAASTAFADKIGLVIPLEGPFKLLGNQAQAGAEVAATLTGNTLVVVEDTCQPESGAFVADTLKSEKAAYAIGFLCLETLSGALPMLKDAGIAAITTGVRADSVTLNRAKTGYLLQRLAPRDGMEAEALAKYLLPEWASKNFAIIDDGTIRARDLAESFRQSATEAGLKPVFTDTYRPGLTNQAALARRLRKAGATHVFVGGDIEDAMVISRDAKDYGGLVLALGESALPTDVAADHGKILALSLPDLTLAAEAAAAKLSLQASHIEPENYALLAHAAVEIAARALTEPRVAGTGPFDTAVGTVSFDGNGDLAENPFQLVELTGGRFTPVKTGPLAGQ
jgi:branched-chain amino acid transport system substrate-binding protein